MKIKYQIELHRFHLQISSSFTQAMSKQSFFMCFEFNFKEENKAVLVWCTYIATGWPVVLEFLELLELFLNCKWSLKNPWNNEFLRICSWSVLEFYLSSFIKNSAHLFFMSHLFETDAFIGFGYYFMMLRLS